MLTTVLGQYEMGKGFTGIVIYSLTGWPAYEQWAPCLGPAGSHHCIDVIRASQSNFQQKCQDNMINTLCNWTLYFVKLLHT